MSLRIRFYRSSIHGRENDFYLWIITVWMSDTLEFSARLNRNFSASYLGQQLSAKAVKLTLQSIFYKNITSCSLSCKWHWNYFANRFTNRWFSTMTQKTLLRKLSLWLWMLDEVILFWWRQTVWTNCPLRKVWKIMSHYWIQ